MTTANARSKQMLLLWRPYVPLLGHLRSVKAGAGARATVTAVRLMYIPVVHCLRQAPHTHVHARRLAHGTPKRPC